MKKRFFQLMCLAASVFSLSVTAAPKNYADYVNPWVGTGGHGHVFLGANVPFGYVQLGPTGATRDGTGALVIITVTPCWWASAIST